MTDILLLVNTSSTKSLPSIYWVFVNFLWASPNVWKIHKHLKLAKVHLENIQGVKLLEMQRTIPLRSHQKCVEVYSKNDLYCEQKWLDMWFIRCVSLGSFFISSLPIRSSLWLLNIVQLFWCWKFYKKLNYSIRSNIEIEYHTTPRMLLLYRYGPLSDIIFMEYVCLYFIWSLL